MNDAADANGGAPVQSRMVTRDGVSFAVRQGDHYDWFWKRVHAGEWEPQTFQVLRKYLNPEETMLDIGAWIGPTVLFGAMFAGEVIAVEPDPVAHAELMANLALNPKASANTTVVNACLAPETGRVRLYAGGFHHSGESAFGDSMSSLYASGGAGSLAQVEVEALSIADLESQHDFSRLGFVKMDIEGGEYLLLTTMGDFFRRYRPTLFISFHLPPAQQRTERIQETFEFLCDTFSHIYTARGQDVPLREVLAMRPDWSSMAPDSPAEMMMTVARGGLIATF